MKYVNQKKHPHLLYVTCIDPEHPRHEAGKTTTVATSGCGLCSSIIVGDRLLPDFQFTLEEAIELSYAVGANRGAGTSKVYFPAFAEKFGLRMEFAETVEELLNCLRTGGAAVVHVVGHQEGRIGLFARVGHYMAAVGIEPDGRVAILDPAYYPGKFEEEGRQGKVEMKNEVLALCTPEILHEETRTKNPPYVLFWRA